MQDKSKRDGQGAAAAPAGVRSAVTPEAPVGAAGGPVTDQGDRAHLIRTAATPAPSGWQGDGRVATVVNFTWPGRVSGPPLPKTPTGIRGLDEITVGGLPRGRTTLVCGAAGTGKTLLGLEFLMRGALEHNEPGVLVTFEESAAKVATNVASLGFDLEELQRRQLLVVDSFRVDPSEIIETGEFDLEPLFLLLGDSIRRVGARRVVLDTIEVLFGAFHETAIVRAELSRLFRWLEEQQVTAIVTGERGDNTLTRTGIEEYVSDCVISLDHRVREEISTRRLRIVKYRGSAHGPNEYPFLISARGFVVLPVTSVALAYDASSERVSTGVPRLDHMLSGGVYRGSTVLLSGAAGTGKTTFAAYFVDAACARGERALVVQFEESPAQLIRNMRSVGLDLGRWVECGLLHVWAARSSAYGLEAHLTILSDLLDEFHPAVVALDGLSSLGYGVAASQATSTVVRQFDLLKTRGISTFATALSHGDETSTLDVSSVVDTWLLLRNVESNGERNRLLFVLKSRGSAHSNQVREFVLTDAGVALLDPYVGPEGALTGSARLAQEERDREAARQRENELERGKHDLRLSIAEDEARLSRLQDGLAAKQAELKRIAALERREARDAQSGRTARAARRWSDPPPGRLQP